MAQNEHLNMTLFIIGLIVSINADMKYPSFTWNTVPTYIHMCNQSGPFNEATNKRMATYPIVTIEKCQGIFSNGSLPLNYSSQYEENKIIEACKAVKLINDNVTCIFYLNSILDFNNYYLHIDMIDNPGYKLRDDNGVIVYEKGAASLVPMPPNGYWVFDYQQEKVQNLFISECINASMSPYVDGCFLDRSTQEPSKFAGNYTFSNQTNERFTVGHNNVLFGIQNELNKTDKSISINNNNGNLTLLRQNGIVSIMMENFRAHTGQLQELTEMANAGIIVEAHVYAQSGNECENIINSLSCYLMGAQKYSYYACSKGWTIEGWPDHDEYHKPLGEPLGDAVINGDQYTRKFKGDGNKQTIVEWNNKTLLGKITWPDGTVQMGKNGSQV